MERGEIGIILFTYLSLIVLTSGYPDGGPLSICNDPYPHHHGEFTQTDASPYTISLNQTHYIPGDVIRVTIRGDKALKGVHLGAHATVGRWEVLYGEFIDYPNTIKPYRYYSKSINCITQRNNFSIEDELQLLWKAPARSIGDILFSATMMVNYSTFWANVTALLSANEPIGNFSINSTKIMHSGDRFDSDLNLHNCGKKSGCITYPPNCESGDCLFKVSYKVVSDGIRLRLTSKRAERDSYYISLGISEDIWMDKDETFTCMDIGGSLDFAQGFNPAYHNVKIRSEFMDDITVLSVDGALSCEFTRRFGSQIQYISKAGFANSSTDYLGGVTQPKYHLYLAWGHPYAGAKESIDVHEDLPIVSNQKVAFGNNMRTSFFVLHDAVKVHAMFMVVAWFGCSAIAIVIGRYFRAGFQDVREKLCGVKTWFQVHRMLTIIAGILTAAGFIIVFVFFKKLSKKYIIHAGFGITLMIMTVIQIVVGLARPDPKTCKKISVFNWFHKVFGVLTHVVAAVTMFLGSRITYMDNTMKVTGTGLLAGLVATQVVAMVVFEILSCCKLSANKSPSNGHAMTRVDSTTKEEEEKKVEPLSKRQILLPVFIIYCCLIVSLLVCFLTVLWVY